MKSYKFYTLLIALFCSIGLFAQSKREFDKMVENAILNNDIYTIHYPKNVKEKDLNSYFSGRKDLILKGYDKYDVLKYGDRITYVRLIRFTTVAMNEVAEKRNHFASVNERAFIRRLGNIVSDIDIELLIETRKKYREFQIVSPNSTSVEVHLLRYKWNDDLLARFIEVYSFNSLFYLAWTRNPKADEFIKKFKNHKYAEERVRIQLETALNPPSLCKSCEGKGKVQYYDAVWLPCGRCPIDLKVAYSNAKSALPLLRENNIDVSNLQKLMNSSFEKDLSFSKTNKEKVESYMFFTEGKYFSKNSVSGYYGSVSDFKLLLSEINRCSPLQKIISSNTNSELTDEYISGFCKINNYNSFLTGFPDKRQQIFSRLRSDYVVQPSYYNIKWSSDIQSRINDVRKTREVLNTYINANVPDSEGMQLARQYVTRANEVISQYERDLPNARAYEARVSAQAREYKAAVERTRTPPPYQVISRKQNRDYREDIIEFRIPDLQGYHSEKWEVKYKYDNKKYEGVGAMSFNTLAEYILHYARFWSFVDHDKWGSDVRRDEKLLEQINKYGINQWYKVSY